MTTVTLGRTTPVDFERLEDGVTDPLLALPLRDALYVRFVPVADRVALALSGTL